MPLTLGLYFKPLLLCQSLLTSFLCVSDGSLGCAIFTAFGVFLDDNDISKTDAARITKCDVDLFHRESWKSIYFGVKRPKSWGIKTVMPWVFLLLLHLCSKLNVFLLCVCSARFTCALLLVRTMRTLIFILFVRHLFTNLFCCFLTSFCYSLDWFSHFCRAHPCNEHTHLHADGSCYMRHPYQ